VKGHSGDKYNEMADGLAVKAIDTKRKSKNLTHIDSSGKIRMVDVSEKKITERLAIVEGSVVMKKETLEIVKRGELEKGDIITLARSAGITAAKSTPTLIPLCHSVPLSEIKIEIEFEDDLPGLKVRCITKAEWKTGVEIEAFNGVSIACVTIYDMCKSIDRSAFISDIKLIEKSGGNSGSYTRK
jgi:cyclic pyranopterin phosphate synthase